MRRGCPYPFVARSGDHIVKYFLVITLACLLAATPGRADTPAATPQKAVLVTGASTGIGRKITERLAAGGYFVYAGARKDADLKELGAIKNVQAVRLDVTDSKDIAAAVEIITKAGRGLYGLVNNAGVAIWGAFTDTKEEDFDFLMQVNLYGPYRITKAFAPLIVAEKGRITTIGSISGILAARNSGVYSMSKHAIEAFADSLAAQMAPLGVQVSVIEPGNYNSEIGKSAAKRLGVDPRLGDRSNYKPPDEVAEAVTQALFEPSPKRRYMVVPNQTEAEWTIKKAIEQLVQLNEGQAYTYEREAMVRMLDEALANARPKR
jgi:NAD(P)-dependent dehydrogenase (short-subunit alcohol dehydrogenase family)